MIQYALALLGAALVLAGSPAARAQGVPTAEKILKRMDQNGDGQITRAEWLNPPPAFQRIDLNGDGVLTAEELQARFGGAQPAPPAQIEVKWIDVHTHPAGGRGEETDHPGAIESALKAFETRSLAKMILMPNPQIHGKKPPSPFEDFLELARPHPDKFDIMGGGGSLNDMIHTQSHAGHVDDAMRAKFRQRAEDILAKGAVGFGEISILHVALVDNHAFEDVPADHPLLLLLADIAAEHDVPIDIHFDPVVKDMAAPSWMAVPPNPPAFKPNIAAFERFVAHNPKAKIAWAHAGSDNLGHWSVDLTRRMLATHPNLYMSLRMSPGRAPKNHPMGKHGIKREWLSLFKDFPDRFMIGNDQFFVSGATTGGAVTFAKQASQNRERTVEFLAALPKALARKIGHENAMRLYKMNTPRLK